MRSCYLDLFPQFVVVQDYFDLILIRIWKAELSGAQTTRHFAQRLTQHLLSRKIRKSWVFCADFLFIFQLLRCLNNFINICWNFKVESFALDLNICLASSHSTFVEYDVSACSNIWINILLNSTIVHPFARLFNKSWKNLILIEDLALLYLLFLSWPSFRWWGGCGLFFNNNNVFIKPRC